MPSSIELERGGDKSHLLDLYAPVALFLIPSELRTREYVRWLTSLMQEFILCLSDHMTNKYASERFCFSPVAQAGGIGGIYIDEEYFMHTKLYVFDGESRGNISNWKGVRFVNHLCERSKVGPLYLLAERFEFFLQSKGIRYARFGSKTEEHRYEEVEMVTHQ